LGDKKNGGVKEKRFGDKQIRLEFYVYFVNGRQGLSENEV